MSWSRGLVRASVIAVLTVATAISAGPHWLADAADEPVEREVVLYQAPVSVAVADPFRPPAHIGAPGNRGLKYGLLADGQPVSAAAGGIISFAGPVAGRTAVTIRHADGVRTSYTGMLEIWVQAGQRVERIHAIGIADSTFHFGARVLDHYIDPQILIDESVQTEQARLVPEPLE